MTLVALLSAALLFGGMVLYSFGFAAILFATLPSDLAGATLRRAFPYFYLFVILAAGLGALTLLPSDRVGALILAAIAVSTVPTRQILMPAINNATDTGAKGRFKTLHGLSVGITLVHIALAGWVLSRFIG